MALYYPPITPRSPIFANSNYAIPNTPVSGGGTGTITEEFLATNYLQFPGAQGVENFGFKELQLTSTNLGETATLYINPNPGQDIVLESVQSNGSLTIQTSATLNNTMVLSPSTGITFGDGTTQDSAFVEANYAQLNTDNTFLPGFTNTFQGTVDLGSSATALTQISGNNSTLLATTAFVQDAVQISGVQVGDSPLLWYGANTNQYNSGTPGNLPYNYPYGISTIWNLSSGGGDCDLVCNSGTGANSSAFNIYCVQGNTTGTQLQTLTPQLRLSNNGTSAFLKDGLDVNNQDISNIGTLNIGNSTILSTINTNLTNGITTLSNNNVNGGYTFNVNGGPIATICNMLKTGFYIYNTLDMNGYNIANIGALSGLSPNITFNSNILMSANNNIDMNSQNINNVNIITPSQQQTLRFQDYSSDIFTLNYLGISAYQDLNMQNNDIINCNSITDTSGQFVTTSTPPDNTITTAIATTGYVATAIANIPAPVLSGYALLNQGGVQQWSGNNTCSNGIWDYTTNSSVLVPTVANTTNNTTVASTAFVKANAGVFTQTSITATSSIYYSISPSTVNVISTYTSANNVVSFNSVNFNIVVGTIPTFLLATLNFSSPPFSGAPPSPQQNITMYSSNGASYIGTISWLNATQIYIGPPAGISLSSGQTFTVNLSTLGAFTP